MNKITLLTAGIIASAVAVVSYNFLADDVESTKGQQQVISESVPVKTPTVSSSSVSKSVIALSEKSTEQKTVVVDENSYVRAAPPPPVSAPKRSNNTKDGHYNAPQAHGHEEVSDNHEKNAPPPPTGAN